MVVATGVARPESVAAGVRALGLEVAALKAFPDHHDFREEEVTSVVREAAGQPVVVTEKDAVKWESGWDLEVPLIFPRLNTRVDDPSGSLRSLLLSLAPKGAQTP